MRYTTLEKNLEEEKNLFRFSPVSSPGPEVMPTQVLALIWSCNRKSFEKYKVKVHLREIKLWRTLLEEEKNLFRFSTVSSPDPEVMPSQVLALIWSCKQYT